MFGIHDFAIFLASGILLNLTPGQDTIYILGRSVAQGRRAGVLSVFGIITGCAIHTLAAAFGLSAILAASARAFFLVKMAGAIYLTYLGIRLFFDRSPGPGIGTPAPADDWAIFRSGFLSNILNPKVALFFLAFLPQFVTPDSQSRTAAFLFLGAVFMTTGTLWCLVLAWFGSAMSHRFQENPSAAVWIKRTTGALFAGMGVKLAVSR